MKTTGTEAVVMHLENEVRKTLAVREQFCENAKTNITYTASNYLTEALKAEAYYVQLESFKNFVRTMCDEDCLTEVLDKQKELEGFLVRWSPAHSTCVVANLVEEIRREAAQLMLSTTMSLKKILKKS